jgi:hypothetical protein
VGTGRDNASVGSCERREHGAPNPAVSRAPGMPTREDTPGNQAHGGNMRTGGLVWRDSVPGMTDGVLVRR